MHEHAVSLAPHPDSPNGPSEWKALCSCGAFQYGAWLDILPGAVGHLHEKLGQVGPGSTMTMRSPSTSPGPIVLTARLPEPS